jgi:hypothetical protein
MSDDPEYDEMMKCERKVKKLFKARRFRMIDIPCCATCRYAGFGYEGEIDCCNVPESWNNGVSHLGLCDAYESRSEKETE